MYNLISKAMFPKMMFSFADGDATGGSTEGDNKNDTVSKTEYENTKAHADKLEKELEDMRMEIISPEYLEFLNSKSSKGESTQDRKEIKQNLPSDDELSKLTPKQILELAKKQVKDELQGELESLKKDISSQSETATKREIAVFARTHEDFEKFRPIMYGLSLSPANKDLSLDELYNKAKNHVRELNKDVPDSEKERQRKLSGERPNMSSVSFMGDKKVSNDEAAAKAAAFMDENFGPIPSA